ncbi:MAG: hypothetical protein R3B70_04420 [Polyangiaceae bacterium]
MLAVDFRVTGIAGKTFFDILSPYLVLRAFGGPVFWEHEGESETGGDKYHFQIGAGMVLALPRRFDAFVEVVPVGERAAALGLSGILSERHSPRLDIPPSSRADP